ncbi:MAG: hypothetical protein B6I35_13790 [Anaerolineaceae bacterium 4572_32.2]|nr:MAG: hypothetical protein B6I35_13790 [Anaerolineaceae bacterium 4572_32.2]
MRVFIGGVMQGSKRDKAVNNQDYRRTIAQQVKAQHPESEIVDPWAMFPGSMNYDANRARQVLFDMAHEAAKADIVIAYLPQASMGTALEMVRAYDAGTPVISISPMAENWFIRSLSRRVFPSLASFCAWVETGELARIKGEGTEAHSATLRA